MVYHWPEKERFELKTRFAVVRDGINKVIMAYHGHLGPNPYKTLQLRKLLIYGQILASNIHINLEHFCNWRPFDS